MITYFTDYVLLQKKKGFHEPDTKTHGHNFWQNTGMI